MSDSIIKRREATTESQLSENIHPLLRRLLAQRGITQNHEIHHELTELADPFLMKDMHQAIDRLLVALIEKQKIIIVGDFDADGATSTALAMLVLEKMGFDHVGFMVPNRFEYGYGLSEVIVDELAWQKPHLLITVDNGISSVKGVAKANHLGIDVIITDHHLPGIELPAAVAIINPNQSECNFPGKNLAGVGVVFYLLIALRKRLRETGWFEQQGITEPNLASYLDLVALGTVADVVPMDFYNRILVAQGIKRIRNGYMRPGIRHLLQVASKDYRYLSSVDLGFAVGPRLNAAGRLDDMTQGIMLLVTESEALAGELAQALDDFNRDRRVIEQQMQKEALLIVEEMTANLKEIPRGFCLFHQEWHQGVVGLVASRLKEKFHRPVIAFARAEGTDQHEIKGSGRSIKGIHLRDVLDEIASAHPGLLNKFGGHAMAAGLSLEADQLQRFQQAFEQVLQNIQDNSLFESVIESDGEIENKDMNLYTAQLIRDAMPWGQQLPEPLFDGIFYLKNQRIVGTRHLKMQVVLNAEDTNGIDAIHFSCDENIWPNLHAKKVAMVYRLSINHYRGEQTLQLIVDDIQMLD